MTSRLLTTLALAAALAACTGAVDPLPPGANVTCGSSADCPSGSVCSVVLSRCVPATADDRTPPGLVAGSSQVTPAAARAGTLITVAFDVDEDLASDPVVRFQGATDPLGAPRREGRHYTVQFPASVQDGAGLHQVVTRLVDVFGNVAETVPVGTVTMDFTPPTTGAPLVAPAWARAGSALSVRLTFDEPLGGTPTLTLGDAGPSLAAAPVAGSNDWTFTRTLVGSEPEGLVDLLLDATDQAGNPLARRFTGAAAIDFTVPTVQAATIHTPAVRGGDSFLATVQFSEPLGATPAVALVPVAGGASLPVVASAIDATTWSLSLDLPAGTPDGAMQLSLQAAADRAGNPAAPQDLGPAQLDSTAPAVLSFTPDHLDRLYRAGDAVQVTFETSEPLPAPPLVRLELLPTPLGLDCALVKALAWVCTSPQLSGTELPESVVTVSVTATDAAGNVATSGTSVVLDFTPPRLLSAAAGRPAFPAGGQVSYLVTASEPLGTAPTLTVKRAGAVVAGFFGPPASAGATTYTWSRAVPSGGDGDYTVDVTLVDEAGNAAAAAAGGGFTVDTAAPTVVGSLTLTPAKAAYMAGDRPAVTFTVSEDTPLPVARLGTTTPIGATCLAGGTARTFTCTLDRALAATDLPQGANALLVTLSDAAGNVGYGSKALALDYAPPTLAGPPGLQLIPGPTNLRSTITAVGPGSTARLTLTSAEPLQAAPAVVAQDLANGFQRSLSLVSQSGTTYVYDFTTGGNTYPATSWTVTWDPVDLAGNQWPTGGKPAIATIPVNSTPPAAPSVGAATSPLVLWRRAPWGSDTSATPTYQVTGLPAATSGGDLVVAWDGSGAGALEVARAAIGGSGFTLTLPGDPADLWISAVDGAGNASDRTRVVDVAWTAGMAGKLPGSAFENPHKVVRRAFSTRALQQADDVELSGAALGTAGDGLSVTTAGAGAIFPVSGTAAPAARRYYGLAQDAGRGVLVLYGGQISGAYPGDTWEWNGTGWKQIVPTDPEGDGNPATEGYWGTPMAYDPVRGAVLLLADHLWAWNGTSWKNLDGGQAAPGFRYTAGMAWDVKRGVMVVFGGGNTNDTWEWNGSTWRQAAPATSPPVRSYHGMVWCPALQKVLVFGGMPAGAGSYLSDLWTWDGTTWVQLTGATGLPAGGRADFAMAWDPVRSELIVQGGAYYNGSFGTQDGKTFALRNITGTPAWVDVTPATPSLVFSAHRLVYEQRTNRLQLFGDTTSNALYQWSGFAPTSWTAVAPGDPEGDGNPAYLSSSAGALAYNGGRGVTVFQESRLRQTWEWNRASWARKANGAGPSARSSTTIGNSGTTTILFGGYDSTSGSALGDTWSWNGATSTWALLIASPVRPGGTNTPLLRENAAMFNDSATGTLYRFGGDDYWSGGIRCYPDLYSWNGTAWVLAHSETWPGVAGTDYPPPYGVGTGTFNSITCAAGSHTAFDAARRAMILFDPNRMEAWELQFPGLTWVHHAITGYPYVGFYWSYFYDGTLGVTEAFDGANAFAIDLTANTYRVIPVANPFGLTTPASGKATFDDVLGKAVGLDLVPFTFESGSAGQPAHLLTVDFSRANGPDPGLCIDAAACPFQSIDVRWTGGATSPYATGGILQAWNGEWYNARGTSATPAAQALVNWTWTPATGFPASSLFHGSSKGITFALVPSGASSAAASAQVATDAVSVTFRYRRP